METPLNDVCPLLDGAAVAKISWQPKPVAAAERVNHDPRKQ